MGYNILGLIPCQTPSISLLWKAKTSALGADSIRKNHKISASGQNSIDPSPLFNVSIKDLIVVKFVFFKIANPLPYQINWGGPLKAAY